jgi:ElaB/YqjD/DUF883 family membrane-anchored ribosome-binding protein
MKTPTHSTISDLAEPAQNLVDDAQELLTATAHVAEEKVVDARRRLVAAIEKGKDAWRTVQSTAVKGAKATDHAIRENPYKSVGIAFGVGILVGYLARRRD